MRIKYSMYTNVKLVSYKMEYVSFWTFQATVNIENKNRFIADSISNVSLYIFYFSFHKFLVIKQLSRIVIFYISYSSLTEKSWIDVFLLSSPCNESLILNNGTLHKRLPFCLIKNPWFSKWIHQMIITDFARFEL